MLKNKFKIIAILSVIILAFTLPIVKAENETTDNPVNPDETTESTSTETTEPLNLDNTNSETVNADENDEDFKKSDVYLTGDNVTIDYIIDGNLFVVANHVTINSQVGGDAFICANTVTIGEDGYVFSNLFTFSRNVVIQGVVYDLYSASENTTINGYVYRDIRVGSNTVTLSGTIGRNAYIDCNNVEFVQNTDTNHEEETNETSQSAAINGNLKYSAKQEISIPEGIVTGEITYEKEVFFEGNTFQKQIMSLGTFVATVIIIWLLCLWLTPKFIKNNASLLTTKKILPVIGFGILTPIVGILASILLFILGLTSKIALLLIITLIILMMISTSIFIITINNIICKQFNIEKRIVIFGMLVACTIVLWLLNLIPVISSIIGFVTFVLGLGMIISSLVLKNKTEDIEKV